MNVLIIGGTRFQGRYLIDELINAGHTVTVFHRGSHSISSHECLNDIIGDRNSTVDLARLNNLEFHACIDTCAYFPKQVSFLADTLKIPHYCLISSVYVYADRDELLFEDSLPLRIKGLQDTELTINNYGALKFLCEEMALKRFGNSSLILRPSMIIGMGDHTERLLFWMRLAAVYGKRLNITKPQPILQFIDVRDLARFTVKCIEIAKQGAVNVCGEPLSLEILLDEIELITGLHLDCKPIFAKDLAMLGLDHLPFCDTGRLARYSSSLAHTWGLDSRDLRISLNEIYRHYRIQGFTMQNYRAQEIKVMELFS